MAQNKSTGQGDGRQLELFEEPKPFDRTEHCRQIARDRIVEVPAADVAVIMERYNEGASAADIREETGWSVHHVLKTIREHGGNVRARDCRSRKHTLDERYFACIDSEDKAYWLGMMAADGSVDEESCRVQLCCKAEDTQHLHTFRTMLSSTSPIITGFNGESTHKDSYLSTFAVHSRLMVADLVELGIIQNKAKRLKAPSVQSDLVRHLWRGWIDGDGTMNKIPQVVLYGTENAMTTFGKWVKTTMFPDQRSLPRCYKDLWRFTISGGRKVPILLKYLYQNATVALPRKLEQATDLIKKFDKGRPSRGWLTADTLEEMNKLYQELGSWRQVAFRLDLSPAAVCLRLQKLQGKQQ